MQQPRTLIIAEAGVNHNGSLKLAKMLVDAAKAAGADIVKFQTAVGGISKYAPKAVYQKLTTGEGETQAEMIKKLLLPLGAFADLKHYCDNMGIRFLSTAFDIDSVNCLKNLGMGMWKIPSGEVTNLPLLIYIAKLHEPVVMSTGMCDLTEIRAALDVLRDNGAGEITLLHCNTEYPTPYVDVNLHAMQTMRETFHLPVGYSDHTQGIEIPIAAVALGAAVIEKHFTLNRTMEGPDHRASLEPCELASMVQAIRHVEAAMGTGEKNCSPSEARNKDIARKSIVAARDIRAGETFTEGNIAAKRPGNGISPMRWDEVLGKQAKRNFGEDELIEL